MNLYKIWQDVNNNADTYDSAVVAASTEEQAKRIIPGGYHKWSDEYNPWMFVYSGGTKSPEPDHSWVSINDVKVRYLGQADKSIQKPGVIVASFNAG